MTSGSSREHTPTSRRIGLSCAAALTAAALLVAAFVWLPADAPFPFALALLVLSLSCATIAGRVTMGASLASVRRIARVGVAGIAGVLGLFPIAMVAERMNWPFLSPWALGHGTFIVVVPVISAVVYFGLTRVPGLRNHDALR
jgi:hypothetical protein